MAEQRLGSLPLKMIFLLRKDGGGKMLTKICFQPWYLRMIHAGGMICPCCAMGDTDYGDFLLDYLEPKKRGMQLLI